MSGCPPPSELEAFAAGERDDPRLRAHIESCAACRSGVEDIRENQRFLSRAGDALRGAMLTAPPPESDDVPGYRLIEEVARGGQGVVFRALQAQTKRPAAVKMLLGGGFVTERARVRFEREIELAASLRHPSIVSVFESGFTAGGRRYVAMEFVDGVPIDEYARERAGGDWGSRAWVERVSRLFVEVADGVGFAQSSGVIHRDLKPSNILVDRSGRPRVLDFGLARGGENSPDDTTVTIGFAGTPAFAPPEQLSGESGRATAMGDVYSLGVTMYVTLTGRFPYPVDGPLAGVIRHVTQSEPVPPSRHVTAIPVDLETIILKSLAKEPARRYPGVQPMGEDIGRWLRGEAIDARRDSALYVLGKLAQRHLVSVMAGVVVLLTVLASIIGLALLVGDLDLARRDAEAALSDSVVQRGRLMGASGDLERAESMLWDEAFRAGMGTGAGMCFKGSAASIRSAWSLVEFYARLPRRSRESIGHPPVSIGSDTSAGVFCVFDRSGSRSRWSNEGQALDRTPSFIRDTEGFGAWASAGDRIIAVVKGGSVVVRDVVDGVDLAGPAPWHGGTVVRLNHDATLLVTIDRETTGLVRLLDAATFSEIARFEDRAYSASFARPRGSEVLLIGTTNPDPGVLIRKPPDWQITDRLSIPAEAVYTSPSGVRSPVLMADGRHLAASYDENIMLYDLSSSAPRLAYTGTLASAVVSLAVDESGTVLAAGGLNGEVAWFSLPGLEPLGWLDHGTQADVVSIIRDPLRVVVVDHRGRVSIYDTEDRPWLKRVPVSSLTIASVAVAPDGTSAWGDAGGKLSIRSPGGELVVIRAHRGEINSVSFSPDGGTVLTGGADGAIHIWQPDGTLTGSITVDAGRIWSAVYSPDGRSIAAGCDGGRVLVWDRVGAPPRVFETGGDRVPTVAFSPDGATLLGATIKAGAVVWDVRDGSVIKKLDEHGVFTRAAAFSPDGRWIVTGGDDRTVRVWNATTGERLRVIEGLPWGPFDLAFHPDGTIVFAVGRGGEVLVLDSEAGVEVATLDVHEKLVFSVAVAPGGTSLLTSGQDPWIGEIDIDRLRRYIRGNEPYWRKTLRPAPAPGGSGRASRE